jgi:hypothetical protein
VASLCSSLAVLDYRPHSSEALEELLQRWVKGKKSKIWLHVTTVLRECPGLELNAFRGYLLKTPGRSAAERGFDWIT